MASKAKSKKKSADKMALTMHEFKGGKLHSGSKSGPVVKNKKQAVAIGISQANKAKGIPEKSYGKKKSRNKGRH